MLARPVDGLVGPRPSLIAKAMVYNHDRTQRSFGLHMNYGSDGGNDSGSDSPPVEESANTIQEQPQKPSKLDSRNSSNNDPSPRQIMAMMGTSPRRIFLSLTSSTTIALAANFFGITSNILSALPEEYAEKSGLDSFYPRGDYKRVTVRGKGAVNNLGIVNNSGRCSFLIPKEWVADTGLALAQAQQQARALDYSMTQQKSGGVLPDAAYGPPGRLDNQGLSNADTNVSVIVNNGVRNFSLASLGSDPTSAAEVVLSSKFGPRNGTRTLVSATEERRGYDNIPVYLFEYTVDRGERAVPLRAISVVAGSTAGDAFVTLTVVSPEEEWKKPFVDQRLRRVVGSFKLI